MYEPKVGDVVIGLFDDSGLARVDSTEPLRWSLWRNGAWEPNYHFGLTSTARPATPSELAAAGLAVPPPSPTPAPEAKRPAPCPPPVAGSAVGIPRRIDISRQTPIEAAIRAARDAVEAGPAHPHMTRATTLLGQALDAVADFVDGVPEVRP